MRLSRKWKSIISSILVVLLLCGGVFAVVKLVGDDDLKTVYPVYARGSLNSSGEYVESDYSIYTKNAFDCQGLKCTLDFSSDITYKVYFYDVDDNFLSVTSAQDDTYNSCPDLATSARIVITPNVDENGNQVKIGLTDIVKYGTQLKIQVNKEQVEKTNLYVRKASLDGYAYNATANSSLNSLVATSGWYSGDLFNVGSYTKLKVYLPLNGTSGSECKVFFATDGNTLISYEACATSSGGVTVDGNYKMYTVNIPSTAKKIAFSMTGTNYMIVYTAN